jgi:hypothetical protein
MKKRARITLIYLTGAFLLMGTAFSFAAVGSKHAPNSHASIHQSSDANDEATPEATESPDAQDNSGQGPTANHPVNHGFYVSQAAQCKNVDDPATPKNPDFTAPTNCTGKAKGQYVSSVAKSDIGKSNHGHGHH